MSGILWTFKEDGNCKFGYSWEERGKIDWFAFKGDSVEIKKIQEEIHKFKPDKDYSYTPNGRIENWEAVCGECEKYTIHNEELKKKLWELVKGDIRLTEHERTCSNSEKAQKDNKKAWKNSKITRKNRQRIWWRNSRK